MREVTTEKIKRYLYITRESLASLEISAPEGTHLRKVAEDYLLMARSYYQDAEHYFKKGDYVTSLSCVCYAHAWLDAGVRLGVFKIIKNREFFTF